MDRGGWHIACTTNLRRPFVAIEEDGQVAAAKHDTSEFAAGDHVAWNTPQGETTGVVKKKLTKRTEIRDHDVAASPDNPEYLVVSDKSGAEAAHRPDALRKINP